MSSIPKVFQMNIKQFLNENGIDYSTGGKNVSKGWIGVRCPFCDDTSDHFGIRLKDFRTRCWKCGLHSFPKYLVEVLGLSWREAKETIQDLDDAPDEPVRYPNQGRIVLPRECTDEFPKIHLKYLKNRGFNPRKLIRKYNLKACYTTGKYAYRIIIPIYDNGRLITWTSRDVTGKQSRYRAASIEESAVDPSEAIYNFDNVKEYHDAFLVEGPTDVWKMGDGSFCFMGVKYSQKRFARIIEKNIRNLFIFYDQDRTGNSNARQIAKLLAPLVKKVRVVKLNNNFAKGCDDPGSMSFDDIRKVKIGLDFNG
jgi:DNA primase